MSATSLHAYALQERGLDTVQANVALGLPVDGRDYGAAADFLIARGVRAVRLLTNNPDKVAALTSFGVACAAVVAMPAMCGPHSRRYLLTKSRSMGQTGLLGSAAGLDPYLSRCTTPESPALRVAARAADAPAPR